jgi:hypothetical protein
MFLITNADGEVELEIEAESPAAVQSAIDKAYPKHTSIFTVSDPTVVAMEKKAKATRKENPSENAPAHAMKISGLPWDEKRGVGFTMAEVDALYPVLRKKGDTDASFKSRTKAGLAAAHRELQKYFPSVDKDDPSKPKPFGHSQWATPAKMAKKFLKANTKTSKAIEGADGGKIPPSFAVGINVMPFALGAVMSAEPVEVQEARYYADPRNRERPVNFKSLPFIAPKLGKAGGTRKMDYGELIRLPDGELAPERPQGFCAGSSDLCRKTCLVFTGQNGAVAFNDVSKMMTERALFFAPLAFARMLIAAIEAHYAYCKKKGLKPFVRLNVYSDIPWELLFPDLFDHFEAKYGHDVHHGGLWFYDYSKVPGRGWRPKPNYDLTFSYSGGNISALRAALKKGERVAVVFLRATASGSKNPMWLVKPRSGSGPEERIGAKTKADAIVKYRKDHPGKNALQATKTKNPTYKGAELLKDLVFEGAPVTDGDPYDMRALDPPGVVVGLRFKVPKRVDEKASAAGLSRREAALEKAGAFVLKPPKYDEKFLVHAERLNKDWFFTQVTPPQTNVDLAAQLGQAAE